MIELNVIFKVTESANCKMGDLEGKTKKQKDQVSHQPMLRFLARSLDCSTKNDLKMM